MTTLIVNKTFGWAGTITKRAAQLMRMFGVSAERLRQGTTVHCCRLNINCGDVVYITGPSGSGKSVLLRELQKQIPADESINLDDIELNDDVTLIDCINADFAQALRLLSIAGLNDVFCMLNKARYLSEGQKYRFALATALAAGKRYIFADEFCSNMDRITASVISYNIRKFAKRKAVTFILASAHEDILAELVPDVLVVNELTSPAKVIYKEQGRE